MSTKHKTDYLMISYLLLTAILLILIGENRPQIYLLAILHLSGASLLGFFSIKTKRPASPTVQFIHHWYPLVLFPLFFKEVEVLAKNLGNWELTGIVQWLEGMLFRGQPAEYLCNLLPYPLLSEYLHFCYFSYLPLLPLVGGILYFQKRRQVFQELVFLVSVAYCVSFLFFIFFPVDSPFYLMAPPGPPLSGNFFYELVHFFASRGGARGGAFPSTHVSISMLVLLVSWKHQRTIAWVILPLVTGIQLATVYGRFHYALDVFAGILLALVIFLSCSSNPSEGSMNS